MMCQLGIQIESFFGEKMRNCATSVIFVLAVLLVFSAAGQTQNSKGPVANTTGSTPDLSGVWVSSPPAFLHSSGRAQENAPKMARGPIPPEIDEADEFTYRHSPYPMLPWAEDKFNYNRDPDDPYTQGRNEVTPALMNCSPQGPTVDWQFGAFPFEIIQSPKRVLIIFERDHEVRQIWTDGREHPKDFGHNWMGHSIGHWEGDTLVADTIGLNDLTWLDKAGHVHTDALHLIERLQRVGPDKLVLNITFDDPKTFTMPWSAKKTFQLKPKMEIEEEILCEDKFLGKTVPLR
jgi:hypothetical protein